MARVHTIPPLTLDGDGRRDDGEAEGDKSQRDKSAPYEDEPVDRVKYASFTRGSTYAE
jgi:hypothetical protein